MMKRMIDAQKLKGDLYVETKTNPKLDYFEISEIIEKQPTIIDNPTFIDNMKSNKADTVEMDGLIVYNKQWLMDNLEKEFQRLSKERNGKNDR